MNISTVKLIQAFSHYKLHNIIKNPKRLEQISWMYKELIMKSMITTVRQKLTEGNSDFQKSELILHCNLFHHAYWNPRKWTLYLCLDWQQSAMASCLSAVSQMTSSPLPVPASWLVLCRMGRTGPPSEWRHWRWVGAVLLWLMGARWGN